MWLFTRGYPVSTYVVVSHESSFHDSSFATRPLLQCSCFWFGLPQNFLDPLPHLSCRFVSGWQQTSQMPSKGMRLTHSGSWMRGWPRSKNNSWDTVKLSPVVEGRPSKWGCLVPCTSLAWGLGTMSCGSSCGKCWTSWAFMMEVSLLLTGFTGNREATFGEIFTVHRWEWLKMYEHMY